VGLGEGEESKFGEEKSEVWYSTAKMSSGSWSLSSLSVWSGAGVVVLRCAIWKERPVRSWAGVAKAGEEERASSSKGGGLRLGLRIGVEGWWEIEAEGSGSAEGIPILSSEGGSMGRPFFIMG